MPLGKMLNRIFWKDSKKVFAHGFQLIRVTHYIFLRHLLKEFNIERIKHKIYCEFYGSFTGNN